MMIPKVIHYCWFGGNEMPPLNQACLKTWKILEEYEIKRWDETNCPMNPFIQYHLEQKNWAFVSDYVRLYALYTEGGIYIDTDFEVLKTFDDLLQDSGFIAWESESHITNGIAGSVKEYKFFQDCMDYMLERFEKGLDYHISPVVTTNVFNTGEYDIKVYDKEYFYPYNPYDKSRAVKILMYSMINNNTYAIHHWAKSWEIEELEHKGTGICVFAKRILSLFSPLHNQLSKD